MSNKAVLAVMCMLGLCLGGNAFAADTDWTGLGDGMTWEDAGNWSAGAPDGLGAITQTFGDVTATNIVIAGPNGSSGSYVLSGGSMTNNGQFTAANEGTGYVEISGGADVSALRPANGETATMLVGYYRQARGTLAILGSGSTIEVESFSAQSNNSDDKNFTDLSLRTLRFGFDAGGTSMIDVVGDTFNAWRIGGVNAYMKGTLDLVDLGGAVPGTYTVMRADSIGLGPLQLAGGVDPEIWSYELVGTGERGDGQLDELRVTIVPEPASITLLALCGLALGGFALIRRRR